MTVSPETIEALRITLQQLEHSPDPDFDLDAIAQLKQILVKRIAELEIQLALSGSGAQAAVTETSASVPSMSGSPAVLQVLDASSQKLN